jgi:hypothetical protein
MKFLRYLSYLFYSYYSKGSRRNVAYLSAILAITFLSYIHIIIIVMWFKLGKYFSFALDGQRGLRYLKLMLLMSPIFFFYYFGITEKKLEDLRNSLGYDHFNREINHRYLLFTYIAIAFIALVLFSAKNQ